MAENEGAAGAETGAGAFSGAPTNGASDIGYREGAGMFAARRGPAQLRKCLRVHLFGRPANNAVPACASHWPAAWASDLRYSSAAFRK